jgi:hypothetical protein
VTSASRTHAGASPPQWAAFAAYADPLETGAYMLYLQQKFGDPLAFVHALAAWGRIPRPLISTILSLFQRPDEGSISALLASRIPHNEFIDLMTVVAFIAIGCIVLIERRWSKAGFVLLSIVITFKSGLMASQRRYVWVLFPAFIVFARWG